MAAVFFFLQLTSDSGAQGRMRNIVSSQRNVTGTVAARGGGRASVFDTAKEAKVRKTSSSKLTLQKKLKFAQWKLPPLLYRVLVVVISLIAFAVTNAYFNIVIQLFSLLTGPLFMSWLLNTMMERRFKAFDNDYPQMLLSLVGLLKTGMNAMGALEAASQGLDETSLVKEEIDLMITRLRYGVPEDKSIGSFGEDIYHPEIELFVQALLLSRRVGGNLSDTLDRLAKQVRKRQYFRNSAKAAVGMQRGSIWFILGILCSLEIYLYLVYPEAVLGAIRDETGWLVWQFGLMVIALGMFWVRQVTKIKI